MIDLESKIRNLSESPVKSILTQSLPPVHYYRIKNGGNYLEIDAEILSRASAEQANADNLLALAHIADSYYQAKKLVPESIIRSFLSQILNLYRSSYDKDMALFYVKDNSYRLFFLEQNYYIISSLMSIYRAAPRLRLMSRTFLAILSKSIVDNMSYYDRDKPGLFHILQKSAKTDEVRKFVEDTYESSPLYGIHISTVFPLIFGKEENFISPFYERLESSSQFEQFERFGQAKLFGKAQGYDREIVDIYENKYVERIESRYPFNVSLRENIRLGGIIYGPEYILDLIQHTEKITPYASINEYKQIETEGNEDQIAVAYAWLYSQPEYNRSFNIEFPPIVLSNTYMSKPAKVQTRSLKAFSWNTMPTYWIKLEDRSTREFHDAYVSGIQYGYRKISDLDKFISPNTADASTLDWLAFINGVNREIIPILPRRIKESLIGSNRAILKRRSTYGAMNKLSEVFNNDFIEFLIRKPYQPNEYSVHRHTSGGMWTFEIEPGYYNENEIKKVWKSLSLGYTSARYLLILTAMNTLTRMGSTGISEYRPEVEYPKNSIVRFEGKLWRKLADTRAGVPPTPSMLIWRRTGYTSLPSSYIAAKTYYEGDIIIFDNYTYVCEAQRIANVRPELPFTVWGEIREKDKDGKFYTGPIVTGETSSRRVSDIGYEVENALNHRLTHLSTAWRYPSGVYDDYSVRLIEKDAPRKDIYFVRPGGNMIYNSPTLKLANGEIKRSSSDRLLNEGNSFWKDLLNK